ncbi:MAG: hypothetical protein ACYTGZ_17410, partial [Planctomycetota bacterium]
MFRALAVILALAAPLAAKPPGLGDLFDPASRVYPASGNRKKLKQDAFDRLLASKGSTAVLKALRRIDPAVVALEKARDAEYERFLKVHAAYFGWRAKNIDDAEAVPTGLNKKYMDGERDMRRVNSVLFRDLAFFDWAVRRLAEREPTPEGKYLAGLLKGLKDKSPYHRLRCLRLLGNAADPGTVRALRAAQVSERHPAVAAAIAESGSVDHAHALLQTPWTVRAGGIRGLRSRRDRASAALLVPRLAQEKGRLADDLHDALTWTAGAEQEDWAAWWKGLPADWNAPALPEGDPPAPEIVRPARTASGRGCFG